MRKNGLKTFICSFLLSLLTIFLADKYFFRPIKTDKNSEIKITSNNITLFVKEEPTIIAYAETLKVDKEELIRNANEQEIEEYASLLETSSGVYNDEAPILYADDDSYFADTYMVAEKVLPSEEASSAPLNIALSEDKPSETSYALADTLPLNEQTDEAFLPEESSENIKKLALAEPTPQKIDVFGLEKNDTPVSLSEVNEALDEKESIDKELKIASLSHTEELEEDFIPIQRKQNESVSRGKINIKTKSSENAVAMTKGNIPIESVSKQEKAKSIPSQQSEESSPWVVAKSRSDTSNFIPQATVNLEQPSENLEPQTESALFIEPKKSQAETKVADMVRNILIPIPEDILKEGNVTPQLISSQKNKELQEKIEQNLEERKSKEQLSKAQGTDTNKEGSDAEQKDETKGDKKTKKTIFDSLSSIFSGETPIIGTTKIVEEEDPGTKLYKSFTKASKKDNKVTKILPTEIKLSFQPNRAEISGPTLRWLEAFANKVKEDNSVFLEVRIDGTSSFELQQKRLRLLHNILTNKGVEYNKINTVFTTREPNSFIIRAVRDDKTVDKNNKEANNLSKYYQTW
ncbi:MAG: hypothetical protein PHE89_02280 [Alphaproteobacteria bacterium]|nr:hypothetical protein [Alphaproteobacteria bacterium]